MIYSDVRRGIFGGLGPGNHPEYAKEQKFMPHRKTFDFHVRHGSHSVVGSRQLNGRIEAVITVATGVYAAVILPTYIWALAHNSEYTPTFGQILF
jgi:hypothetical protein